MIRHSYRILLLGLIVGGCSSDLNTAPSLSMNGYWELRLNHHAIQLSLRPPYNSLQLTANPYTANGELWVPITTTPSQADSILDASPAEFISRDSTKVLVSSTGLITARAVQAGNVFVVATRKLGNSIHVDSALVRVTDVVIPPVLDTLHVRPRDGDSAKVAVPMSCFGACLTIKSFVVTAKDTAGAAMANLPIYFTSSNPSVAEVGNGRVVNRFAPTKSIAVFRPGKVVLQSETWIYGVTKYDTLLFTVGYPINGGTHQVGPVVGVGGVVGYMGVGFGPGATVGFYNRTGIRVVDAVSGRGVAQNGVSVDIVFDDSMNVLPAISTSQNSGGGNIRGIPGDTTAQSESQNVRFRRFLKPGIYMYKVLPFNTVGKIIIHDK